MTRRASSAHDPPALSRAFAALVACTLLLAACAPRVPTSDSLGGARAPRDAVGHHPAARLSPGCATSDARSLPERLVVAERDRALLVDPPRTGRATPHDLVIAFHGRTNDAEQARDYFGLGDVMPHALIAYPQALPAGPGAFAWSDPDDPIDEQRDFAFVAAIVDAIGSARCVDLDRVFVVGHSLGAYFANDLACNTTGLVRAVASVAGGLRGDACVAPTAALLLHHPDDRLVPIAEGERARDAFLSSNGLARTIPTGTARPPLSALRCVRVGDAAAAHPVVWCSHDATGVRRDDPHGWPAGTAAAIATFFDGLP